MRIALMTFVPAYNFDFKTESGPFSHSKEAPTPILSNVRILSSLRRKKRLRYEIRYTWADLNLIHFMENHDKRASIKVKFAWKELKVQEKLFPIYVYYLNRFLWH